ncbi:BA75_03773T0 [Komagataella pastoris]|uniref:DNA polymerase epsilon subunit B n=1 Tax=Komagataella pastoris TaxID=4922 RepID=A0A1B2JG67_PICPA|nr:BA75_03773T0 [Komagataella pastoris]
MSDPVLPIELHPASLRPLSYRVLSKKHGLHIKSEALAGLAKYIGHKYGTNWNSTQCMNFLDNFGKIWKEQDRGLFIDKEGTEKIIREVTDKENKREEASIVSRKEVSLDFLASKKNLASAEEFDSIVDKSLKETYVINEPQIDWRNYFQVVNYDQQPIFRFNSLKRQLELFKRYPQNPLSPVNLAQTSSAVEMFLNRYNLVYERLIRDEEFKPTVTKIKNLLGRNGSRFLIFGLISYNNSGNIQLQDDSDAIELDISRCTFSMGYFVPGCLVVCDGIYSKKNVFHCLSIAHPPAEKRETSMEIIGNLDLLGIHSTSKQITKIDPDLKLKLMTTEKQLDSHRILVLGGNIFLDDLNVLDALKKLFTKLTQTFVDSQVDLPLSIVFNGPFTKYPLSCSPINSSFSSIASYKAGFDSLASILEKFPEICKHTTLIFVPHDNDLWPSIVHRGTSSLWPHQPISNTFITKLTRIIKACLVASNPTKLNYLSQEIILVRDDTNARFKRNQITKPAPVEIEIDVEPTQVSTQDVVSDKSISPEIRLARKIVKTVLDQGHLSPFTTDIRPILWDYDPYLHLYPSPNLLVLCDPSAPKFDITYMGCHTINPGKFLVGNKCSYTIYNPSTSKCSSEEIFI